MDKSIVESTICELKSLHGPKVSERIEKGVAQAASFWREEDGSADDFQEFCRNQFIADPAVLQETAGRFEGNLEIIAGHYMAINRELHRPIDLDEGPIRQVDFLFANFSPQAHMSEDFFKTKIAFSALLNFPRYSLRERLEQGGIWTREKWAQVRLVQGFDARVPASVEEKLVRVSVAAGHYISSYNIFMNRLLAPDDRRLFPEGLKLISHWGLRDELRARYAGEDGLDRQKLIQAVMERIIRQEIPKIVIDNPDVDWAPHANEVSGEAGAIDNTPEGNERYRHLLDIFRAEREADPYYPQCPSHIRRRFEENREIPEDRFRDMLVSILTEPVAAEVGKLVSERLARPLLPFDIWYNGFKPRRSHDEAELDEIVRRKYPDLEAFQTDLPVILRNLGFDDATAGYLSDRIVVDPSRGAGHAMRAGMRSDRVRLRTRMPEDGMNYKGYNIAIHELGHNVEQVFSLHRIDHTLLRGVPNTAFTEGFAFVFQARDLELLGFEKRDPRADHLRALDSFWSTFEIAGVALVDMEVWHWMYDHSDATPEELKGAVIEISRSVWNQYFAPIFGRKDEILLAIYSHMIAAGLYLPDYPLGHIIAFQMEQFLKKRSLAMEMERMCRAGSITPDAWMTKAVGSPVSTRPLLDATQEALRALR